MSLKVSIADTSGPFLVALERVKRLSLEEIAQRHATATKGLMHGSPRGGQLYLSRRGDGSWHKASAEGEPPAVDVGELVASVGWRPAASMTEVGSTIDRGLLLEYGTSRAKARPAFRPALMALEPQIPGIVVAIWQGTMSGGGSML